MTTQQGREIGAAVDAAAKGAGKTLSATGIVAVDAGLGVGGLFMWIGHGQTARSYLAEKLEEAGFGELAPETATVEAILRRCLRRAKKHKALGGRLIVSTVERTREWAIVVQSKTKAEDGHSSLEHAILLHARIEYPNGKKEAPVIKLSQFPADGSMDELARAIEGDCAASLGNLSTDDITEWLMDALRARWKAVQTMPGIRQFFVPSAGVDEVTRFMDAIKEAAGYETFMIPAMRSEEAAATIIAALEREAIAAAEAIQREIEESVEAIATAETRIGFALRARTMALRGQKAEEMRKKLALYAEQFGRPAEAAANQVQRLRANILRALEYAEAKHEGRDAEQPVLLDLSDGPSAELRAASAALTDDEDVAASRRFALIERDDADVFGAGDSQEADEPAGPRWDIDG